jgi:hypothetical protein
LSPDTRWGSCIRELTMCPYSKSSVDTNGMPDSLLREVIPSLSESPTSSM